MWSLNQGDKRRHTRTDRHQDFLDLFKPPNISSALHNWYYTITPPPVAAQISLHLFPVHKEHGDYTSHDKRYGYLAPNVYLDWITKRLISDVQVTAVCPSGCHWPTPPRPSWQLRHSGWSVSVTPWKVNQLHRAQADTGPPPVLLEGVNQSSVIQFQPLYG